MLSLPVKISVPHRHPVLAGDNGASTPDFPQQLAEGTGIHVVQLRRCEAGISQRTIDVTREQATALQVSADMLLFGKDERGLRVSNKCRTKARFCPSPHPAEQ